MRDISELIKGLQELAKASKSVDKPYLSYVLTEAAEALEAYRKAFEDIREEIKNKIEKQNTEYPNYSRYGTLAMIDCLEIIDKHNPALISPEEAGEILKGIGEDDNPDKVGKENRNERNNKQIY